MSNYATDLFMPIFDEISRLTGARAYTDKVRSDVGIVSIVFCLSALRLPLQQPMLQRCTGTHC
jgi:hypothetical protein